MKIFNRFLAFVVGGIFVFSGLVKLNDPVGTQIKLEEYFEVFMADTTLGLSSLSGVWEFFLPYSLSLGILMSLLEVILGFNLAITRQVASNLWSLLLLVVFFGFLTFYSAYFDKVTDCGCFGDAIKFTPWQSFGKDMILGAGVLFLLIQYYRQKEHFEDLLSDRLGWIFSAGVSLASAALAFYAVWYLPPIDFRPYKIGNNIAQEMKPSAELKYGKQVYTYTNLQTGKDENFEKWDDKYADTTQYTYKSYEKPLLNPEALPKITDYLVTNPAGEDVTQTTFEGKVLLIVIQDIQKCEASALANVENFLKQVPQKNTTKLMLLTGNDSETFQKYYQQLGWKVPFFFVDMTVLKTMIRSNPGVLYLENGTVKAKYPHRALPEWKDLP